MNPGIIRIPGKDFVIISLKKAKYSRKRYLSQHEIYKHFEQRMEEWVSLKKAKYSRKRSLSQHEIYKHFEQRMEDWAPRWNEPIKFGKRNIISTEIFEIKYLNHVRARSTHDIIWILRIKLEEDLILPNLPKLLQ